MNTNASTPIPYTFTQPPIFAPALAESARDSAAALRSLALFTIATIIVLGLKWRHQSHWQTHRGDEENPTAGVELSNMEVGVEQRHVEAGVVTQWMYQYCGMFL